jgi:transposase
MDANGEVVNLNKIELQSYPLGHLGLISVFYEELQLKDLFDSLLPKNREHKISHGTAVLAFLLNGLSFSRRQLYLFPEFFQNLPLERLFGDAIEPAHLNEFVMGELLDKIYAFGPTELFARVVSHILKRERLDLSHLHADTTNFSVHGEYKPDLLDPAPEKPAIQITFGHPKDGRWDLKRFVLSLLVNTDGIPLFMKAHSGNASDHQTIKEAMVSVQESLKESIAAGEKECILIADAAFYTKDNIQDLAGQWVSRVPGNLVEARELLKAEVELKIEEEDPRYAYYETASRYGEVEQKWVLVHSAEMEARMKQTFEKHLAKQIEEGEKALERLKRKEFACEADALKYAAEWSKKYPYLKLTDLRGRQERRRQTGGRGRPRKEEELKEVSFIEGKLVVDEEKVAQERRSLGRFILSSNATELSGKEILETYKEQMKVERGFRFLKNKSFLVSETYLKKPERIEALSFIMVLCLLVYSLLEYRLRDGLERQGKTIPNSVKKATDKPTLQWALSFFAIIAEVKLCVEGVCKNRYLTQPHDVEIVATILSALGLPYEKFYSWG